MKRDRLLALGILITYASLFHADPGWNVASRLGLVYSVVDQRSLNIDAYHEMTGDKAYYRGHFYSDKAMGHAVLGVPLYAMARLVLGPLGPDAGSLIYHYLLKTLLVSVPSALGCLLLLQLIRRCHPDPVSSRRLVAAYAVGTLVLPYSVVYYAHQQVTVVLLAAFVLVHRKARWSRSFAIGLLIGYGFLLEYPIALAGAVIAAYHLLENRRTGSLVALAAGVTPSLILLGAYNWACFGSPFSTGYSHKYLPYLAHVHSAGFMGIAWPSPTKLASVLFAPKGMVATSPFLLLALPGIVLGRKHRLLWAAAAVAAVVLLFNASLIWEPFGGWTPGPRYSVPALAFLVLLCAPCLNAGRHWKLFLLAGGLTGLAYHGLASVVEVHVPEEVGTPLVQYFIPLVLKGCTRGAGAHALVVTAVGLCLIGASVLNGGRKKEGPTNRPRPGVWIAIVLALVGCWACLVRPVKAAWGHYHVGTALLECGRQYEAERYLELSIAEDPRLQPAHSRLGLLYAADGRTELARQHLERALALRASDEVARQALRPLKVLEPETDAGAADRAD